MSTSSADKVLLIDDDAACRRLLRKLLERAGYQVDEAADGIEGFERVLSGDASIVITDWEMPGMDGRMLIQRIRETELAWYPYILLLTGSHEERQGLETGADDFISKPVREDLLLPRLRAGQRIMTLQERLRERNLELNQAVEQLRQLAVKDPLTGLLNRRAALEGAQREWRRCQRYDVPLSCLMLDIDFFKRINDTYGHASGDAVIRRLGETLSARFRATDVISRHGGEEFCLLLVESGQEKAILLAQRLLESVRGLRVPEISEDFRFTISCGLASRTSDMDTVETLIDRADQALLAAKRTGRDRYVVYDPATVEAAPVESIGRGTRSAGLPAIVGSVADALRRHAPQAAEQSQRVAALCRRFAAKLKLPADEATLLESAVWLRAAGQLTRRDGSDDHPVERKRREASELLCACFGDVRLERLLETAARLGGEPQPTASADASTLRLAQIVRLAEAHHESPPRSPEGLRDALGAAAFDSDRETVERLFGESVACEATLA